MPKKLPSIESLPKALDTTKLGIRFTAAAPTMKTTFMPTQ